MEGTGTQMGLEQKQWHPGSVWYTLSWAKTRVLVGQTSPPPRSEFRIYYPISNNSSETEGNIVKALLKKCFHFLDSLTWCHQVNFESHTYRVKVYREMLWTWARGVFHTTFSTVRVGSFLIILKWSETRIWIASEMKGAFTIGENKCFRYCQSQTSSVSDCSWFTDRFMRQTNLLIEVRKYDRQFLCVIHQPWQYPKDQARRVYLTNIGLG